MSKYIWIGEIYADWFREPLSPLEKTWRLPFLFKEGRDFIKKRLGLKVPLDYYQIRGGYVFIRNDWLKLFFQPGTIFAPIKFLTNFFSEKENWEKQILPESKQLIKKWQKQKISSKTNVELWNCANQIMKEDTNLSIRTVYVGIYSISIELLLSWFYKLFVRDQYSGYQKLLIGFPNQNHKINQDLQELAKLQQNNHEKYEEKRVEFTENFGFRSSDWDIVLPTFGEQIETINQLIKLHQENPDQDFNQVLKKSLDEKNEKAKFVLKNLRFKLITRPIFSWILKWSWEYIPLREDRAFWGGSGIFFVRRCLNLLGKKLDLEPNMIYYLKKQELEKLLDSKLEIPKAKSLAQERFKLREKQKEKLPL